MNTFNSPEPPVKEIQSIISECKNILVISHMDPDGDSLGTLLAFSSYLRSLGKTVYMVRDGIIPQKYEHLDGIGDILDAQNCDKFGILDAAIVLECPNLERMGRSSCCVDEKVRVINIDHHRDNDNFGELNWINLNASSVGEMIYEYFEQVDYKIDIHVANQLFIAIMTDTGRFRYRSTSKRTMEIAGKLIEAGADPQFNCDQVYYNIKPSTMLLTGKVLNKVEFYNNNKICIISLTTEMLKIANADSSEADGFVDYTLYSEGVDVGAFIKEKSDSLVKVSLRSKDNINVAQIAGQYGGGGHFNAAGFKLEMSFDKAKKEVIKVLSEALSE